MTETESNLESLRKLGYDPQTKCLGMGWLCTLEINMRIRSFHRSTEGAAVWDAVRFTEGLGREASEEY